MKLCIECKHCKLKQVHVPVGVENFYACTRQAKKDVDPVTGLVSDRSGTVLRCDRERASRYYTFKAAEKCGVDGQYFESKGAT